MLEQHIVGVWQLVSCEGKSSDGQIFLPYGSNPTGKLIYTQDGHMSVILMNSTRPRLLSEDISQASEAGTLAWPNGVDIAPEALYSAREVVSGHNQSVERRRRRPAH